MASDPLVLIQELADALLALDPGAPNYRERHAGLLDSLLTNVRAELDVIRGAMQVQVTETVPHLVPVQQQQQQQNQSP